MKVRGIEERVDKKIAILPQLAATGIGKKEVKRKTSWKIIWGPVYAKDIPKFLEKEWVKEDFMRKVTFTFVQRLEMAVVWAIPFSMIGSLIIGFIWLKMLLPLNILIWGLAFLLYILFPYYQKDYLRVFLLPDTQFYLISIHLHF
ncbi:MAG: hypothetical protein ACTSUR_04310 [Candidatus Heimdallarchaeaceae archaeon]